jgi:hypothetical protein
MSDSVNSKEALFMLDTDIEEDMKSYGQEATELVIGYINKTPELFKYVKGNLEYGMSIKDSATTWAHNHGDEFGELFITELDVVKWEEVAKKV